MPEGSAATGPTCLDQALDWLRKHFDAEAARDLRVVYRFELTGPGGADLYARIDDGRLEAAAGSGGAADVRFRLTAQDFLAILAGRANADWLFMEDRIEVEGDLSLALRMRKLFRARG
jgi:predicted lipid carrier protein YhbT